MAETGHIKNVENLGKARDFASSRGGSYQPSNPNLAVGAMTALIAAAGGELDNAQNQRTPIGQLEPMILHLSAVGK